MWENPITLWHSLWQLVVPAESIHMWQTSLTPGILASIVSMQEEHRDKHKEEHIPRRSTGTSTRPEFLPSSLATQHQELEICRHRETKIFIHNTPGLCRSLHLPYLHLFWEDKKNPLSLVSALLDWTRCSHTFSFLFLEGLSRSQWKSTERQPTTSICFGSSPKHTPHARHDEWFYICL